MKMFEKGNFLCFAPDKKQRLHSAMASACLIIFFVLSAFTFMNFLYCLADCAGSIVCASADVALKDALRSMPIFLSFFLSLGGLLTAHAFYRNESPERLKKSVMKHSFIVIAIGAVIIIYTIIMRIAGRYLSLVEGAPSPLYPLDAVLYAVFFIALGVCAVLYVKKYSDKFPYTGPSRAPTVKKARFIYNVGLTLWLLVSLYGFCGFFYSFFMVDFSHGYLFYTLAAMLVSLAALCSIAVWEFYYNNLKAEKRGELLLPLSIVSLGASVIVAIIYFVALRLNLDGPSNVGFGLLPIAFAANVNITILIVVITPVVVSVTALIKGLTTRKKG